MLKKVLIEKSSVMRNVGSNIVNKILKCFDFLSLIIPTSFFLCTYRLSKYKKYDQDSIENEGDINNIFTNTDLIDISSTIRIVYYISFSIAVIYILLPKSLFLLSINKKIKKQE